MTRHPDLKAAKIEKAAQIEAGPSRRKRVTKRDLARRDLRLLEQLAAGATIEEIAANQGISLHHARRRKAAILAERAIDPPHEFIRLQIRRLSEAMLVAYCAMTDGNLKAVDKVVRIVRELDRYHGFGPDARFHGFAAPAPRPAEPPLLALPEPPAALAAPEAAPATAGEAAAEPREGDSISE